MGGSWETSLQGPMVRGGRWHVHCPLVAIFLLALSSSLASTASPRDRVSCALLTHDGSLDSSFFQMAHLRGVSGSTHGLWAQPLGKTGLGSDPGFATWYEFGCLLNLSGLCFSCL